MRSGLERVAGIEPASQAWKASALPLSYTRIINHLDPVRRLVHRAASQGRSIRWLSATSMAASSTWVRRIAAARTGSPAGRLRQVEARRAWNAERASEAGFGAIQGAICRAARHDDQRAAAPLPLSPGASLSSRETSVSRNLGIARRSRRGPHGQSRGPLHGGRGRISETQSFRPRHILWGEP